MEFKKIILLGPAKNGGVKEVNDSLHVGFEQLGKEVIYIKSKVEMIKFLFKSKNRKDFLCISSLSFGVFGVFFKHSIFILHGYPYARFLNKIKFKLNVWGHKFCSRLNNKTVSVSFLTQFVWDNFFFLKSDFVIHNPETLSTLSADEPANKALNSLVFTGRIVKTKNLDLILKAVSFYRQKINSDLQFHIIGDGPDLKELKNTFDEENNFFHGYVSAEEKLLIMKSATVFISLNEGEPFGLTTLEARLMGLKCILPAIGGHIEFVDKNSLFLVNDIQSETQIAQTIQAALEPNKTESIFKNEFAPTIIAQKYLDCFK